MAEDNVEWVAIITWWFQENLTSTQIYPHYDFTPTNESLKHAIKTAHDLRMKVMLKPMIDTEDARNEPRWMIPASAEWFESYTAFIACQAELAQENSVEQLCVGCEFMYTESDAMGWRQVVAEAKKYYSGPLTYAATKDSYRDITWWDALDYVGIDAYFDLTDKNDPTLEELTQAWNRTANNIESWQSSVNKPIIFTEIGYRNGNGNNKQPWNWTETLQPDPQEQFDCYLASLKVLWTKPWFKGFYWWIWESNPNAGGLNDTDFTPQNKPVEYLFRSWYSSEPDPTIADLMKMIEHYKNQTQFLNNTINSLTHTINNLLAQNQALQQTLADADENYTELLNKYNELLNNYNVNTYLLYILVATTVFFAITTVVYLRRSRVTLSSQR